MTSQTETTAIPKPAPPKSRPTPQAGVEPSATPSTITQTYRKGDVWMVKADPDNKPIGTEIWANRPGIIVSGNVTNNNAGFVQIVYLTSSTKKRSGPTHVPIQQTDRPDSMALCEQIHTIDTSRLKYVMGSVPGYVMKTVDEAIAFSLSLGRSPDVFSLFHKWEDHIKLHGIDLQQEIQALAGHTTDQRVEALTKALSLVTTQRDAYKSLLDTQHEQPSITAQFAQLLDQPESGVSP